MILMPTESSIENPAHFSNALASRLRHDLKGGLISLRLGLEALSDEEDLKELLIDSALRVEKLADKLIALIRVGALKRDRVGLPALVSELAQRVNAHFPQLQLKGFQTSQAERLWVDVEALWLALREVAENSTAAGAKCLELSIQASPERCVFEFTDDGVSSAVHRAPDEPSPTSDQAASSCGLGLEVVRRCARFHGGEMTFTKIGSPPNATMVTISVTPPAAPLDSLGAT